MRGHVRDRARKSWPFGLSAAALWLAMLGGSAIANPVAKSSPPVLAQAQPLPSDLDGYDRFWENQTPAERVRRVRGNLPSRQDLLELGAIAQVNAEDIADSDRASRGEQLESASQSESSESASAPDATNNSDETAERTEAIAEDASSDDAVDGTEAIAEEPDTADALPSASEAIDEAIQSETATGEADDTAAATAAESPAGDPAAPPSFEFARPPELPAPETFSSELLRDTTQFMKGYERRIGASNDSPIATTDSPPETASSPPPPSEARRQLTANVQTTLPLDPSQLNVSADDLSYDPDRNVGIAAGNARLQLSDGTTITGEKLLFYRDEERLVSEGPFRLVQPRNAERRERREVNGSDLDLHIPTRTAEFKNSLTILPGEERGTYVFVRSETTTALVDDEIYFDNATVTTSPEAPITHYVKGDRVEVFPDDRLVVRNARVYSGGKETPEGKLRAGTQLAYFPLFIYSLKAHQWILPGQSQEEGAFVKSSWAYRIDEYNHGGIRFDILQRKGVGFGFIHDYILPIPDSINYGRAQYYSVTEADQQRSSNRYRIDHFFEFDRVVLLDNEGTLKGKFNLNIDNVYRPSGGRNDDADGLINATFKTGLSTSTLNIRRNGSIERGTYSLPLTFSHTQRYRDVKWLTSNVRFNYDRRVSQSGGDPTILNRLQLSSQAKPPGWGGNYTVTYRGRSGTDGDREARKNLEVRFAGTPIRLGKRESWTNSVVAARHQIVNPDPGDKLRFYNSYDLNTSLKFSALKFASWGTFTPGSIDYKQVLYSTDDSESVLTLNPKLNLKPTGWSELEFRYNRVFSGNNSAPFSAVRRSQERDRVQARLTLKNTRNVSNQAPPGYLAFEDDLPGETPIALIFEDDSAEQIEEIAQAEREALKAEIKNTVRFTSNTGYNFLNQRWDTLTANLTWNTSPKLFDIRVDTSYDLNEGELRPIRLRYTRRSSTTFDRDLRSGLDTYEPGVSYGFRAVYDPKKGEIDDYSIDFDATIGTRWQNHWRVRLGLDEDGVNRVEVRRDLRDFELRMAYDPQASSFKIESILVAFPSRPVGLTQERGDFLLNVSGETIELDNLGR
ncbi:MAG: hypothetical protein AAFX40_07600 [Cyanobacteria bacterium J06639_1]